MRRILSHNATTKHPVKNSFKFLFLVVCTLFTYNLMATNISLQGKVQHSSENTPVTNHEVWYFDPVTFDTLMVKTNLEGIFTINLNIEEENDSLMIFTIDPCTDRYQFININPWDADEISINVCEDDINTACEALFTYTFDSLDTGSSNQTTKVRFIDQSKGEIVRWEWNFGDDQTSGEQNPIHSFENGNDYLVQLKVYTANSESIYQSTIYLSNDTSDYEIPCQALFYAYPDSGNALNDSEIPKMIFRDYSSGDINRWEWNFGDGKTSNKQNPIHQYSSEGTYQVTLTIHTNTCSSQYSDSIYVYIPEPPSPCNVEISYINTWYVDKNNKRYLFYAHSSGKIKEWLWDFGDGVTSTEDSPMHTYEKDGEYKVVLTISNTECTNTVSTMVYVYPTDTIQDSIACYAEFGYEFTGTYNKETATVEFYNHSTENANEWLWDFGDGQTSTEQSPTHQYKPEGSYTVSLTMWSDECESTYSNTIYFSEDDSTKDETCEANFHFYTDSSSTKITTGTEIYFYNASQGNSKEYSWDFGDETTASGEYVNHTYTQAGTYAITLSISSDNCESSVSQEIVVEKSESDKSFTTGTKNLLTHTEIKAYPNPATDRINIEIQQQTSTPTDIQLSDMLGNIYFQKKIQPLNGLNLVPIDVNTLKKGKYLLIVRNEGSINSQVIIKQ